MMIQEESLKLNEAIVSINRNSTAGLIDVFYQTKECFGCPLEKISGLESGKSFGSFKIDTRYESQLELRQANTAPCLLDHLSLNSHAHYRIDVASSSSSDDAASTSVRQKLSCKLETIDSGDCLLCPVAVLISILFAFMVLEWLYVTFIKSKRQKLPSSSSSSSGIGIGVDGATAAEDDGAAFSVQVGPASTSAASEENEHKPQGKRALHKGARPSPRGRLATFEGALNAGSRIECLDAFRGLTIAGMIFVNYGGAGYTIWEHKPWNGITLADFVFPFFIFSMGTSIALSVRSQIKTRDQNKSSLFRLALKIIRRSLILLVLGICLNSKWLDHQQAVSLSHLRLTGVLQRFSISYLVVALMYAIELTINKWMKAQSLSQVPYLSKFVGVVFELLMATNYLAIYVYLTFFLEYDSTCPAGYVGPGGQTQAGQFANCTGGAAAYLDRLVFGQQHLYNDHEVRQIFKTQVTHDPEGLLGYSTSILLTLLGLQGGKILMKRRVDLNHKSRLLALSHWMVILTLSSTLIVIVPINKRLWSLTFVVVTALAAFVLISLLYILLDVYSHKKTLIMRLLISAGKNSLFLYVGHSLIYNLLPWWFPISDPSSHLQLLLRLAWATLVWLAIAHYMAGKNLYIKV